MERKTKQDSNTTVRNRRAGFRFSDIVRAVDKAMKKCENCGLPSEHTTGEGFLVEVEIKPENGFQRRSHRTVWCHDKNCAIQTTGLYAFGNATRQWPMTLQELAKKVKIKD